MEEAVAWWNQAIGNGSSPTDPPVIMTLEEAPIVWHMVFPILQINVPEGCDNYWEMCREFLCKLTEETSVPNPEDNFTLFVEFLYKNKEIIHPNTIDACILYSDRMCPKGENNFFLNEFVFGIDDPILLIETFREMLIRSDYMPFIDFLMQYGAMEKFINQYITFLCPLTAKITDDFFEYRILLADLLTRLLTSQIRKLFFDEDIISSFYSRLLNLINYSKAEASICFARDAIQINNLWLPQITAEQASTRIKTLITSAAVGKSAHSLIVSYALSQAGQYISHSKLANLLTKQGFSSVSDLEFLVKVANAEDSDAVPIVIRSLGRVIIQSKVFMKVGAKLFAELASKHNSNPEIKEWVTKFISMTFIFIKLAFMKEKYTRKAIALLEIFSSDLFKKDKWMYKAIVQNANSAYLYGEPTPEIEQFFNVGENGPKASYYEREFKRFKTVATGRTKFKSFPYKPNPNQLLKTDRQKKVEQEAVIDESLRDLGLGDMALRYVYHDFDAGPIDQQQCIFLLEDFIDHEKGRYDQSQYFHVNFVRIKTNRFRYDKQMEMKAIKFFCIEIEEEIWKYQETSLNHFMDVAREIIVAIKQHPHLLANIKNLSRDLNVGCSDDQRYKKLKQQRRRLKRFAVKSAKESGPPNYAAEIRAQMPQTFFTYDQTLIYSPPSEIDSLIAEYLIRSHYSPMIEAASEIVAAGDVASALSTITELVSVLNDYLGARVEASSKIVYYSVIRHIFDRVFISTRSLDRFQEETKQLIQICSDYSAQNSSAMMIPWLIADKLKRRQPISGVFRTRVVPLTSMEFLTNPLDMAASIYFSSQSLQNISPNPLTEIERESLLLGLISTAPPSNTLAIAKMLEHWRPLIPSAALSNAAAMFVRCVKRLFVLDNLPF